MSKIIEPVAAAAPESGCPSGWRQLRKLVSYLSGIKRRRCGIEPITSKIKTSLYKEEYKCSFVRFASLKFIVQL
jgi:hypothetical protein